MLTWGDDYNMNISLIDEQHKKLYELINKARMVVNFSLINALETLDQIKEYAREHFEIEEYFMKVCNFPELESHRNEHIDFANTIIDYKNKVVCGDSQIINEILGYIVGWVDNHIQVTDREYIDCFKKNGINPMPS